MALLPITAAVAAAAVVAGITFVPDPLLPDLGNPGYHATAYDLSFRFRPESRLVDGTATMTGTADRRLTELALDHAGGTVRQVTVDGRPAQFHTRGEKLVIVPSRQPSGRFRVTVDYTADRDAKIPSKVDDTAGWGNNSDGGFVWWGQPDRAHLFFPCNDDLTDKAQFTYRVTVPDGWTAIANGTKRAEESADGSTTFVYATEHPMATQLAQLAVGKFDIVTGVGPHGLPLRSAVPAGRAAEFRPALDRLPEYLSWLEAKIGRRYPFEVAGVLGVDGPGAQQTFALETQTLPVFHANSLTNAQEVVHELAHQWFGDSVGVRTWSDLWLSEGFASYLDLTWAAEHGGPAVDEQLRKAYQFDGQVRAQGVTPGDPKRPDIMFGLARGEGALVVYALRQQVGEQEFGRVLRDYLARYRDGSASSADFIGVAGPAQDGFLRDWLYGKKTPPMPGHPDWTSGAQ
ncbi:M1 family metallopeptidase [Kutzneria albida]|uniref:Aminopeptidase N n=1 Tax=Kutzneria albida DSM 43870 TaxID=1449976 RepID=W5W1H3_9PSEU|nr:M1 family metallopeptidase [Kutzneria albida]AHH94406.1 Peptidase M1 membrane alanine aminopeptidase [Kutzneria albida DSM 43870]